MVGFLVLAMVAVAVGYLYGNYLFEGVFQRETRNGDISPGPDPPGDDLTELPAGDCPPVDDPVDEPPGDDPPDDSQPATGRQTVTMSLDGITLYRIQLGAFGEAWRAEELADSVRNLGLPAYITRPQPGSGLILVWALALGDRDAGVAYAKRLDVLDLEESIGVYPYTELGSEGAVTITLSGDTVLLQAAGDTLRALMTFIGEHGEFWSRHARGQPLRAPAVPIPGMPDSATSESWAGDLDIMVDRARTVGTSLAAAHDQGYPEGFDLEVVPSYLEIVDMLVLFLRAAR